MRATDRSRHLSVQAPQSVVGRLDALLSWASQQPDICPTGHTKRSELHRAALLLGLLALEARAGLGGSESHAA
jgi:hypothetical protein